MATHNALTLLVLPILQGVGGILAVLALLQLALIGADRLVKALRRRRPAAGPVAYRPASRSRARAGIDLPRGGPSVHMT